MPTDAAQRNRYYKPEYAKYAINLLNKWRDKLNFAPTTLNAGALGTSPNTLWQKMRYGFNWLADNLQPGDEGYEYWSDLHRRVQIKQRAYGVDLIIANEDDAFTPLIDTLGDKLAQDFEAWVASDPKIKERWPKTQAAIKLTDAQVRWFREKRQALIDDGFYTLAKIERDALIFVRINRELLDPEDSPAPQIPSTPIE